MPKSLVLEIVTPDRRVFGQEVDAVTAPGVAGEFTILPLHIPFLSSLRVGSIAYKRDGAAQYVFVSGGFIEVTSSRVLVLAEVAEMPHEIDIDRARKARERAEARLVEQREAVDYARAKAALQRAITRIRLHEMAGGGLGLVRPGKPSVP
ncbi:MAG: F0F1 ATP synthase subunit epsilon [Solidesulfovibrio sp.]|uniref:F0F1 ATP synthase subunit epsilon n=1 Tax=Solidesulfovibrio sp. TaxID=2910990 RepID=UPI0031585E6F